MKRLAAAILLALLCQSLLIAPAHARHHKHHHRHYVARQAAAPVRSFSLFSSASSVVEKARSYIGSGAVFGRSNLWCARFMNVVLKQAGYHGTNSDMAMSFARMPATTMQIGSIAVMGRRGGGHVEAAGTSGWSPASTVMATRSSFPAMPAATGSRKRSTRGPASSNLSVRPDFKEIERRSKIVSQSDAQALYAKSEIAN